MEPVISTVGAVAIAASPSAKMVFTRIFGASMDEIGEMIADPIRARRHRRLVNLGERTAAILAERDVEPDEIPDAVSVPLIEAATLADDPTLQEMWAQLLAAHATDSTTLPALTSVLRELSPLEARFLDGAGRALREGGYLGAGTPSIAVAYYALNVEAILGPPVPRENEIDLLKENLVRLRVLATGSVANAGDITFGEDPNLRLARADTGVVCMAPLGIALLEAVASAQTSE